MNRESKILWFKNSVLKVGASLWVTGKVIALASFIGLMGMSAFFFYSSYRGSLHETVSAVRQLQQREAMIGQRLTLFVRELKTLKQKQVDMIIDKHFPQPKGKNGKAEND